ncbi:MAG: class I SAM-dependent methyltransferase [Promethearchaeota archaeon]
MSKKVETKITIEEIRAKFIQYTKKAFQMLPKMDTPHILDIGCGLGTLTMELARLTDGEIMGIDINKSSLDQFNKKIMIQGLSEKIKTKNCSLLYTNFSNESFDIIWAEGVIHLFELKKVLRECNRLLKFNGFLVQHEANIWMKNNKEIYPLYGFRLVNQFSLPEKSWWTEYYIPLDKKIIKLRKKYNNPEALKVFKKYQDQIDMVRKNPKEFDSGFYIMQKVN